MIRFSTFITLSLFALQASALSLIPRPAADDVTSPNDAPAEACAQFAGTYKGTCMAEGRTFTKLMQIEQNGCDAFIIDGMEMVIGAVTTVTVASPAHGDKPASTKSEVSTILWDADKKFLECTGGTMTQILDGKTVGVPTPTKGTIRLDGDKLSSSFVRANDEAATPIASCDLTKQADEPAAPNAGTDE